MQNTLLYDRTAAGLKEKLRRSAGSRNISCGLSERFSDLYDIRSNMFQAVKARDIGRTLFPGNTLCEYWDVQKEIMLSYIESNICPKNYIHPVFRTLLEYDSAYNTSYLPTLKEYIHCHGDNCKTSEALHVHRNTVAYRINKIEELCSCDLGDEALMDRLLISMWTKEYAKLSESWADRGKF